MISRIFDIPEFQLDKFPKTDALVSKTNGNWTPCSTGDFVTGAREVAIGLLASGLQPGDTAAMISSNRPEWNIVDIGMLQCGVVNVPVYTTLSSSEIAFILNDCSAKIVFVEGVDLYRKIASVRNQVPSIMEIYSFETVSGASHWTKLREAGIQSGLEEKLDNIKNGIRASDLATILYTSGTTGLPKGVMLSHNNIVSNCIACEGLVPLSHKDRALSFLPLCHSYERMLTYLYMYLGVSIYYAESMDKIADNLREIQPQAFSTVPRLLEKVYDRITEKGKELKGIKKNLFFWALKLGLKFELGGKNGILYNLQLTLANKLVFSKWRAALGGNVRVIVSGGAALQPRLARVFWAAGVHVLEGYGLTETSPVIAVNNLEPDGVCFGTVGPVIQGVTVKIAEDGEVLCKGPNVMLGYFNRPDLTSEVIDANGWFHTGDIGIMVQNRFLKITDRKKEIFKTSGGKYIAPQALENKFKESLFIEQIMVLGENRKFPSALIVPSFSYLRKWCELKSIAFTSNEDIIRNRDILDRFDEEVETYNKEFGRTEQVKKFILLPKEWTIDSGELTATLKLKRKVILEKYKNDIDQLYADPLVTAAGS